MPKIFVIGDSTVEDNKPPFRGWGWALPEYVKQGVEVKNYALSGCSSLSFRKEGLFEPVEKEMGEGDLLLIQFGHNDEKDDERHTDPQTTFPEELLKYCRTASDKGAVAVLMTPVSRRFFVGDGSLLYTHGEYPAAIRSLCARENIPLIDLEAASRRLYLELGEDKTAELFVRLAPGEHPDFPDGHDDKTHFNAYGAKQICKLVVEGLGKFDFADKYLK
ncbi:MAG: rhamnogalacturonan acetylesterase [Clostridiales bacterium]|nr:rhamnogalacturonan acetylesterase [Clostridiales bacterium]